MTHVGRADSFPAFVHKASSLPSLFGTLCLKAVPRICMSVGDAPGYVVDGFGNKLFGTRGLYVLAA
jgi:hypothetical protein